MRYIIILVCCCLLFTQKTSAQLFFSTGIGKTYVHSNADFEERYSQKNYTWQASVIAKLPLQPSWFFETGLAYQTRSLSHGVFACCTISVDETIHAQYLTLPALIGHSIPLRKKWQLNIMAGPYVTLGIAGNKKGVSVMGDWFPQITYYDKPVSFGNNANSDIARWNCGMQAAASLDWKRFSVLVKYSYDFNDFSTVSWHPDNFVFRMSTAELSLGYRLLSFHK